MYRHDPMIRLCNHISKSCIDRGKIPCRILIIGNDLLNLLFERFGVHHAFFRLLRFGRHHLRRTLLGCTALRFISWNGDRCAFFCRFLSQVTLCYRADHCKHGSCRCSARHSSQNHTSGPKQDLPSGQRLLYYLFPDKRTLLSWFIFRIFLIQHTRPPLQDLVSIIKCA